MSRIDQLKADHAFLDKHCERVLELMEALEREIQREEGGEQDE